MRGFRRERFNDRTDMAIHGALEAAGVEFIDEKGAGGASACEKCRKNAE